MLTRCDQCELRGQGVATNNTRSARVCVPLGGMASADKVGDINTGDVALHVSDYTKGNPDRLGTAGFGRPSDVHSKIHQVDCSEIVSGLVEHSYYLTGSINRDIRQSIMGNTQYDEERSRTRHPTAPNTWIMQKP